MKPIKLLLKDSSVCCSKTPNLGTRPDKQIFSQEVDNLFKSSYSYREGIYKRPNKEIGPRKILSLGGGDPFAMKPFPGVRGYVNKIFGKKILSSYNHSSGYKIYKEKLVEHFKFIGLSKYIDDGEEKDLSVDNLIFTSSTSHAFSLILRTITRPHDVILITGPSYGLFCYYPERVGAETRFINLKKECNFEINPIDIEKKIKEINQELSIKYDGKLPYKPRVDAFLNENPHNPTGIVMSK